MLWQCEDTNCCEYATKCMWAFGVDSDHHLILNRFKCNHNIYICYDEDYNTIDPDNDGLIGNEDIKKCPKRRNHKITMERKSNENSN